MDSASRLKVKSSDSRAEGREKEVSSSNKESLKVLGKMGCLYGYQVVTTEAFGKELALSVQSASRHIQDLERKGFILRKKSAKGQRIYITERGKDILRREMEDYLCIFAGKKIIELKGEVVSGEGIGRYFVRRRHYMEQFKAKLKFNPFPGTLNLKIPPEYKPYFDEIKSTEGIPITSFTNGSGRAFGAAKCFTCTIRNAEALESFASTSFSPSLSVWEAAVIVPERSSYEDVMELISPENLRNALKLSDGDTLCITVAVDVKPEQERIPFFLSDGYQCMDISSKVERANKE